MAVRILDYGGTVQSLAVPDKHGRPVDVVLGYDDIAGYETGSCFFGAIVGRYANRIAGAAFPLGGRQIRLPENDGANHLHGTFSSRIFAAEEADGALVLRLESPAGEEGFPGTLSVEVTYCLTEDNALRIDFRAVTDADTVVNLTNHSYFNLAGRGDVLGHTLRLDASRFTEVGPGTLPTGRILPVAGTALDFCREKTIGADLASGETQLTLCRGYDHNYVFDKGAAFAPCARVYCPETGIALTVATTQPGMQLYTGNFIDEDAASRGKGGVRYPRHAGLALETQHFPDSPNRPDFPSTVLRPGEEYRETTEYRFSAV